jgi:hypothetical protein
LGGWEILGYTVPYGVPYGIAIRTSSQHELATEVCAVGISTMKCGIVWEELIARPFLSWFWVMKVLATNWECQEIVKCTEV